eukprot:TRINITY_DN21110_c0_g2_i1.p1 TRINITY_DN21110_c0_g2~~TRINITY_DN21110_c0_g2_i1.p1  ORF type:complete len:424 (+),score=50.05 TRINITY_DN21110_c0_g2_i1:58-1329(+)
MAERDLQARQVYSALNVTEAEAGIASASSSDSDHAPQTRIPTRKWQSGGLLMLGVCLGAFCTYALLPAQDTSQPADDWHESPYDSSDDIEDGNDNSEEPEAESNLGNSTEKDYYRLQEISLPRCQCKGRFGKRDAYRSGASPAAPVLCASPWGDVNSVQYCFPVSRDGRCPVMMHKCDNSEPPKTQAMPSNNCLCAFDIDRTLTARQDNKQYFLKCPNTKIIPSAYDSAFGGGHLTLSALSTLGLRKTACGACYVGIVSHGSARGDVEREALIEAIMTDPFEALLQNNSDARRWSMGSNTWPVGRLGYGPGRIHSPLVIRQGDMQKQWALEGILEWYASKGIKIERSRVWFFDDRADNALFFRGTGMNSRQISCGSRDAGGASCCGYCGARPDEIQLLPGNIDCGSMGNPGTMLKQLHVHAWR